MVEKKTNDDQKQVRDEQADYSCKVVALEYFFHKVARIVRYIAAAPYTREGFKEPFRINQRPDGRRVWLRLKMIDHILRIIKCRLEFAEDSAIGTKEIKERERKDQQQSRHEAHRKKDDLHV